MEGVGPVMVGGACVIGGAYTVHVRNKSEGKGDSRDGPGLGNE